jgi:hypothetical protein
MNAHGALLLLVGPAGSAPALSGYRPDALLLDDGPVKMVRLAGADPAASCMSRKRSPAELKTQIGTPWEFRNPDILRVKQALCL